MSEETCREIDVCEKDIRRKRSAPQTRRAGKFTKAFDNVFLEHSFRVVVGGEEPEGVTGGKKQISALSGKQLKKLRRTQVTAQMMCEIFEPMVDFVARKCKDMENAVQALKRLKKIVKA